MSPLWWPLPAPEVLVATTPGVKVTVTGAREADAITGSWTPSHRSVVFEKTQHESVAFGELAEQYETNIFDFYKTLERVTDVCELEPSTVSCDCVTELLILMALQNRYKHLVDAYRQWLNLHALKRGGRAHDPEGISGTKEGSLAVECPACPHPDRNLPDGWDKAPLESQ